MTRRMTEIEINEWDEGTDPEGSVLFLVQKKETITRHYIVKSDYDGNPFTTAKALREDFQNGGTESWFEKDGWVDFDNERISKIEKVVYSPCSLALTYMTPPAHWTEESHPQIRYLTRSTMFDEQPEGTNPFTKKSTYRRYDRCTNYIHGKTSEVCDSCLRNINDGWTVIQPLKKEESE
jgi:hypothetical protein